MSQPDPEGAWGSITQEEGRSPRGNPTVNYGTFVGGTGGDREDGSPLTEEEARIRQQSEELVQDTQN